LCVSGGGIRWTKGHHQIEGLHPTGARAYAGKAS
jgi:hypothetical protein